MSTSVRTGGEFKFLVYPCNAVGYIRLALLAASVAFWHTSTLDTFTTNLIFVATLIASSLLDILDGYLARRLRHETYFGKLLDQSTDLMISSVAWIASGSVLAVPILMVEWSTGLSVMARGARSNPICGDIALARLVRGDPRPPRHRAGASRTEEMETPSASHLFRPRARPFGPHWSFDGAHSVAWFARRYFANRQRNGLSAIANVSHLTYPIALILGPSFHWAAYLAVPGLIVFELATMLILVTASRRINPQGGEAPGRVGRG